MNNIILNGIEIEYNNIFYISSSGNDITGNGTINSPLATYDKAFSLADNGDLIYFKKGKYDIDNVNTTGSFICDKDKKLTIYAEPYTYIRINNPTNTNRDTHAIDIKNSETKVIGFIIDYCVTDKSSNYSRSIFGNGYILRGKIYNCHFIVRSSTSFSYANNGSVLECINCQFDILQSLESPYTGSTLFEKCVLNIDSLGGGARGENNLFNMKYTDKYKCNSNCSSYGVMYGDFSWKNFNFYKYIIKQNKNYYSINNHYINISKENNNLEELINDYGCEDLSILTKDLDIKKIPTRFNNNYYESFTINLNDIKDNMHLIEEDNKKYIQYNCDTYKILDKIKENTSDKFNVLLKEIQN